MKLTTPWSVQAADELKTAILTSNERQLARIVLELAHLRAYLCSIGPLDPADEWEHLYRDAEAICRGVPGKALVMSTAERREAAIRFAESTVRRYLFGIDQAAVMSSKEIEYC